MGYDANGSGELIIKRENFDKVVEAYHEWTGADGWQTQLTSNIEAVFNDQGFEISFDKNGNTEWVDFLYEKYHEQSAFIKMLAPWIENGSSIDFTGEDGAMWRISVFNHKFYETDGVVIFPGDPYWEEAEGSK